MAGTLAEVIEQAANGTSNQIEPVRCLNFHRASGIVPRGPAQSAAQSTFGGGGDVHETLDFIGAPGRI